MSFAESVARQQDAIFHALGEDAEWQGIAGTVRVRRSERDEDLRFDDGAAVVTTRFIKVRRSEVPSPEEGQKVVCAAGAFRLTGEPRLDRKSVWTCEVSPAA